MTRAKQLVANGLVALSLVGAPALLATAAHAQYYSQEQREDWHQMQRDRAQVHHEEAERDQALRHGDVGRALHEQNEANEARRNLQQDRHDLRQDRRNTYYEGQYNYGR